MTADTEGLLAAIAAAPDDDVPRLVLADYCDERGDPLGEFIRLQLALEPLRHPCANPAEELERHKKLAGIPPGSDRRDAKWEVKRQLDREGKLLSQHREWLGEVAPLTEEWTKHFVPEFRRGFVASAQVGLTTLCEHGVAIRRCCPALQKLIVLGTLGRGKEMASCEALAGVPELYLAGWLLKEDAAAFVRSRHLKQLRSLSLWIGNQDEEAVCPMLAKLRGLRELTLVQLYGGIDVEGEPEAFDEHADGLAEQIRRLHPACEVRVERPFARRFPLDGQHVGHGITAGHLPDGTAVLISEGRRPILMYFDQQGRFASEEQLDLDAMLKRPKGQSALAWDDKDLLKVLGRAIGFVPGPIFVREFQSELCEVALYSCDVQQEEITSPRTTDPEEGEDVARSIYWWFSTSQFVLPFGNDYWADGLGRIHSS
jgi:uncharacterized protein (TIGR02996 family)